MYVALVAFDSNLILYHHTVSGRIVFRKSPFRSDVNIVPLAGLILQLNVVHVAVYAKVVGREGLW